MKLLTKGIEMARIANHLINGKVEKFEDFVNYNGTINAVRSGNRYSIVHWNTVIFEYDLSAQEVTFLRTDYISQTTSALVGRIIRALPKSAVIDLLAKMTVKSDAKRIARMAGVL
jgi:hypothetical protein